MTTIQESGENYLETILVLGQGGKAVRAVDIAAELNFSKPSVSVAMKKLRQEGYIETDDSGFITLTASGRGIAESVYEKHLLLSNWLIGLGVDKKTATDDACKMEHVISDRSFEAIRANITQCSAGCKIAPLAHKAH